MTKEINNRIQNYDASIYKYCLEHKEKSVFDLMASFFSDKSNLDNKILFNQAEQVAKEFNLNLDSDVLLSFCNRLSILQASNAMSQYIGKMDSHKNMSKQHTANIVMFGDSITDWGPWYELFPEKSIVNRGIAGDNTQGMLFRIQDILPLQPKQVFFLAGINDLAQGFTVHEVFSRYCSMLVFCQEHGIEPIVQSTLYVGSRLAQLNPLVEQLNQQLKSYCVDKNITYINLNCVLCPEKTLLPKYTRDELHLTALAYQEWATIIKPLLNK
ncbi:TPA: SGNH/GDSL hydrolase family protein [Photobacterium damselae]|uniref:SGNH/GDSL hydrolase family protein n=1 Tax=Photobacterium damselae TaxID=38293 RepID=UPI00189F9E0C|nr:SGNH/GDSL hydrolase family protein [Photobacterium damselae]MBF7098516.1 lysophospholipase [Photobacterium damselae]